MKDQEQRNQYDIEWPNLSLEGLIQSKMQGKGMIRERAIEDILETSAKTNQDVNIKLVLED